MCEEEGRSRGSCAVIAARCLRSLIFPFPAVRAADHFGTGSRIYLIPLKFPKQPERSSHGALGRLADFHSTSGQLSATVLGVCEIMETWFWNHVLGLSLSVLLLALQGLLGAGTPGSNSTHALTAGIRSSTDELNHTEKNWTSALYSSESLSPSQRDVLLSRPAEAHTAAAGSFGKVTGHRGLRRRADLLTCSPPLPNMRMASPSK